MTTRTHTGVTQAVVVFALFALSLLASQAAMRGFRLSGSQPQFYQSNFEPAVMMACGRGFVVSPAPPPELAAFLNVSRNDFDCASLPPAMPERPLTAAANANWYYMYGASAALWKITGVSWTALDWLVALMSAVCTVMLYGLFRLVTGTAIAAALAMLLTISPANLTHLLSLRDYSKAPFVLAAVLILGVLVTRSFRRSATFALAAAYGVTVGIGYGFRGDLAVMVPFGAAVVAVFLPGPLRFNAGRNAFAAAALLAAFFVSAWPVINALKLGGCQYHFTLLGLTEPLKQELRVTPSIYSFGPHLLDTFADLKVGDYASRVLGAPVPQLCTADYDTASGQLYFGMFRTFPADFVTRAYASVLMILRVGLSIPEAMVAGEPFAGSRLIGPVYRLLHTVTSLVAPLGVLTTLLAVAGVAAYSVRLGLALAVFVLFLAGYPSIRFDERHWFHLRLIPWWTAALVGTHVLALGSRAWARPHLPRAVGAAVVLVGGLALALWAIRMVQTPRVAALVREYEAAPTEPLPTRPADGASLKVDWTPADYGVQPAHRGSDLVVVTLDSAGCAGSGPLGLRALYDADVPSRDLSATMVVQRPSPGTAATRVFVPVFWQGSGDHTELKFAGLQVVGAGASCISQVARVTSGGRVPLWLEMQVPPDWSTYSLYESMRPPRLVGRLEGVR